MNNFRESLAGKWDFYPDVDALYIDIKADNDDFVSRADISFGMKCDVHLNVNINELRFSTLLVCIKLGVNTTPDNDEAALYLYASINGGKSARLDISSCNDGKQHRAELPLRTTDLISGKNIISISSNASDMASVIFDSDGRPAVRIRSYSIDGASWQSISVPGIWNGNFEFTSSQTKNLLVTLNDYESISHDLTSYMGKTGVINVDVPIEYVSEGINRIILDSSFINNGNMTDESFDLIHSSAKTTDKCFVSHDLLTWEPLNERSFRIRLELKNRITDNRESFGDDNGDNYATCVIGLYKQNNMTYYQRADLNLPSPDIYSAARVSIYAHVGSAIGSVELNSIDYNGVGWYTKKIFLPQKSDCADCWLDFTAVDYKAEIWLNHTHLGTHIGGYTPFACNLGFAGCDVNYGSENILTVRVTDQTTKQTADGEAIMIKETNAGFIQDSIGINYAGIWQDVFLSERGKIKIDDVFACADVETSIVSSYITLTNYTVSDTEFTLKVNVSGEGKKCVSALFEHINIAGGATRELTLPITLNNARLWSPRDPYLYIMAAEVIIGGRIVDTLSVKFGMRSITADGAKLIFNGKNIFLTGMLDWMTDYNVLSPTPTAARVEKQINDLKTAGYNSIKFCLVCPPDYVLDIYDRMGMYVYIEYPIWNPIQTEAFIERSRYDLIEMVKKDRNHPSVILSDFNCEMPTYTAVIRSLMEYLIDTAKKIAPNRLYLDNSSCGVEEFGDFRACHPYYEVTNFHDAVNMWADLRNRGDKKYPIIFGEYADTDTIRDTAAVFAANGGAEPWWWRYFIITNPLKTLKSSGYSDTDIEAMITASYKNAIEAKKYYVEQSKRHNEIAGLYITQINDVNSTQPGIYDEMGNLKYDVSVYYNTNSETSLLLDRTTQNYYNGSTITLGAEISHYGGADINCGCLVWQLVSGASIFDNGIVCDNIALKNGDYYKIGDFAVTFPSGNDTRKYSLKLKLNTENGVIIENDWSIWTYPSIKYAGNGSIRVHITDESADNNLINNYEFLSFDSSGMTPKLVIATAVDDKIRAYLQAGGRVILLGIDDAFIPVSKNVTFNAWAMSYIPDTVHPFIAKLHSEGYGLSQLFDVTTNAAMDYLNVRETAARSIITRVNQRSCSLSSYLCEYNALNGKVLQCTLKLGNMKQNSTIGEYLFDEMIRYMVT